MPPDVALHEAAHALVAHRLGGRVTGLIVRDDGTGATVMEGLTREVEAVVYAAGYESARIAAERSGASLIRDLNGSAGDLAKLRALLPDPDARGAAMDEAWRMLRADWPAVEALADALVRAGGRLDGEAVRAVLGGGSPSPASTARSRSRGRDWLECVEDHIGADGKLRRAGSAWARSWSADVRANPHHWRLVDR
jgi:hypothetical protein